MNVSRVVIKDPIHAYGYAFEKQVRLPNSESYIKQDPIIAKWYQEDVLKGPCPKEDNNEIT